MPSGIFAADSAFPDLKRGTTEQRIAAIQDYLFMLLEQLRYTLHNLGAENFNMKALEELKESIREGIETNVVISNTVITQNLYSAFGDVAELTVDRLLTANKVERFWQGDTSDINYIWIEGQSCKLMTGTAAPGQTVHHVDRYGRPLYYKGPATAQNYREVGMGTEPTAYPVIVHKYEELCKAQMTFVDVDGVYTPQIILGAGDGVLPNSAKAVIYKGTGGLEINYYRSSTGDLRQIKLTDEGIYISPWELKSLSFYDNGFTANYGGQSVTFTWTTDEQGRITSLTTEDNAVIPVTWNSGGA